MKAHVSAHTSVDGRHQFSQAPITLRKQTLLLSAIAMLSDREIMMMSRQDLLDALRMAQSASPRSDVRNIDNMDVTELRRVFAIVREHFRKEVARQSPAKAWSPEFN